MPLFDFFKKSNKKETSKGNEKRQGEQSDKDTLLSPEQQKKRYDAAMDFLKIFQERMPLVAESLMPGLSFQLRDVWPGQACSGQSIKKTFHPILLFFRKR